MKRFNFLSLALYTLLGISAVMPNFVKSEDLPLNQIRNFLQSMSISPVAMGYFEKMNIQNIRQDASHADPDAAGFSLSGDIPFADSNGKAHKLEAKVIWSQFKSKKNTGVGLAGNITNLIATFSGEQPVIEQNVKAAKVKPKPVEGLSIVIKLPKNFTLSWLFPNHTWLDSWSMPEMVIVFSNFAYKDLVLKKKVRPGINLYGKITAEGPLAALGAWINNSDSAFRMEGVYDFDETAEIQEFEPTKFVKYDKKSQFESFNFAVNLSWPITSSTLAISLPYYLMYDFEKRFQMQGLGKPPEWVKAFGFGNFAVSLDAKGVLKGGASLNAYFGRQDRPVEFRGELEWSPAAVKYTGTMNGIWERVFGFERLALEELGIETTFVGLGWPAAVGFRGTSVWGFDDEEDRVRLGVAASADIFKKSPLTFEGTAQNIQLSKFIDTSSSNIRQFFDKAQLAEGTIQFIPFATEIAGEEYEPGFALSGEMAFGDYEAEGGFEYQTESGNIEIVGQLSPIKNKYFTLTGAGDDKLVGSKDDGASFKVAIEPSNTQRDISVNLSSALVIPAINLVATALLESVTTQEIQAAPDQNTQAADVAKNASASDTIIKGSFAARLLNSFDTQLSFATTWEDLSNFSARFYFDAKSMKPVEDAATSLFEKLTGQARKGVAMVTERIAATQRVLEESADWVADKTQIEIDTAKKRIAQLEAEIKAIDEGSCERQSTWERMSGCAMDLVNKMSKGSEMNDLSVYVANLQAGQAAGRKISEMTTQLTERVKSLERLKSFPNTALAGLSNILKLGKQFFAINKVHFNYKPGEKQLEDTQVVDALVGSKTAAVASSVMAGSFSLAFDYSINKQGKKFEAEYDPNKSLSDNLLPFANNVMENFVSTAEAALWGASNLLSSAVGIK